MRMHVVSTYLLLPIYEREAVLQEVCMKRNTLLQLGRNFDLSKRTQIIYSPKPKIINNHTKQLLTNHRYTDVIIIKTSRG